MKNLRKQFEAIVKKHNISTLETQNRDWLDFHEVSVWWLESMLQEAYDLWKNSK